MLMWVVRRDELAEEPEKFVNLLLGKVGVVAGVFYFKGIGVNTSSSYDVRERAEAWVAYWNSDCVVAFLL